MIEPSSTSSYWSQNAEELIALLGSSRQGLDKESALQRLDEIGYNLLQEKEKNNTPSCWGGPC